VFAADDRKAAFDPSEDISLLRREPMLERAELSA
jgi:hypothetical protein